MATLKQLEDRIDSLASLVASVVHMDAEELKKSIRGEVSRGEVNNIRKHI